MFSGQMKHGKACRRGKFISECLCGQMSYGQVFSVKLNLWFKWRSGKCLPGKGNRGRMSFRQMSFRKMSLPANVFSLVVTKGNFHYRKTYLKAKSYIIFQFGQMMTGQIYVSTGEFSFKQKSSRFSGQVYLRASRKMH
jgi:hypothetical protein